MPNVQQCLKNPTTQIQVIIYASFIHEAFFHIPFMTVAEY